MKIAIVGGGISGLVSAYRLHGEHDVTVFEANDYAGGHTNTVDVEIDGNSHSVDTGFIVFNDWTYTNFISLLDELQVESRETEMSFSVSCESTGLEYSGTGLRGLFAQKRNLFNPRFYRLLWDFLRFNRLARELLAGDSGKPESLGEFLKRNRFSDTFIQQYLLPMGSAIWSCPRDRFLEFPAEFIAEFYANHGLLNVTNRPQWRVIKGGSREYVKKLTAGFADRIRLKTPVHWVRRQTDSIIVGLDNQVEEKFDHVVFACHSDQALRILGSEATSLEKEILSAFPYEPNTATLHTDVAVLPKCKRAWASWNYFSPAEDRHKATVTYNMNILQAIESEDVFCVTLNDEGRIRKDSIVAEFSYHHPTFDLNRKKMQARHRELIGANFSSFCGAYWGNGFHEDGVNSALAVVEGIRNLLTVDSEPTVGRSAKNPCKSVSSKRQGANCE